VIEPHNKVKKDTFTSNEISSFQDWVIRNDFLMDHLDPWERIERILIETHKRSLAEQVLLISCNFNTNDCEILKQAPKNEKPILAPSLIRTLLKKSKDEKEPLFWKDIAHNVNLEKKLKKVDCHSLLVYPLFIKDRIADALVIINYSEFGNTSTVSEFVSFVASILSVSLENRRLAQELKRKEDELRRWAEHIEKRVDNGTKKLLEKEFQYHVLFEGAHDGIIVIDPLGEILEVNEVMCQLLGFEKQELIGSKWQKISTTGTLPDHLDFFKKVLKREKVAPLETHLQRNDGSTFQAEISSRRVRLQGKEAIQNFVRNVSLRKALEQGLRESKEKYRTLLESSLIGVFILRNGVLQFVNSMFAEIVGYSKEELIDTKLTDLITPEDRSMVKTREERRQKGEDVPEHYEVQFLKNDGSTCWGEMRACRVILDGETSILGNVIDITQRKRLEMQLLERQKMESIGTLAGGIAHDFNNLLGGVLGYASLLLSDMTKDHPFYEDIHAIAETAKRGADLTNRLLAFARGGKYKVTSIHMKDVIEDVETILSRTTDRSLIIKTYLDDSIWVTRGDSQQIHQSILNICLNSRDAMGGGGTLTISVQNVTLKDVERAARLNVALGDYVCVSVKDTGIGMDEKTKSRMFEPFFSTKPAGHGTGLGLALVYGVVKNHEGAIEVDSQLGEGTEFKVYLPRTIDESEKRESLLPEGVNKNRKFCILLVDDEEMIRKVGTRMLDGSGFDVLIAKNGKEALELFNKKKVDLVLLDLIMPEMGGDETYHKLKDLDPDVKVIFTSGYGQYDRPEFENLGQAVFIQKPFQTEVLLKKIKDILGIPQ